MKRFEPFIQLSLFLFLFWFSFGVSYNPFTTDDMRQASRITETALQTDDPLYQEIKAKKNMMEEAPQDAIIDRVWKKTPGKNGLVADVEKSYENMKKRGTFDKSMFVLEQIPPEVTFDDLTGAPVYRGHPEKQMVSLLINVSWGAEHIPDMLHILEKQNVQATFFIEGQWAKDHDELVKMIDEEDHIIGNHAYDHPDMQHLEREAMKEQIIQTNTILESIIGKTPEWFAPPSGSFDSRVVQTADAMQMHTLLWTVDTIDWKNPTPAVMQNRVMDNIHPGATILMHPTEVMANNLDTLIAAIKEEGYRLGSIETLMSEERDTFPEEN